MLNKKSPAIFGWRGLFCGGLLIAFGPLYDWGMEKVLGDSKPKADLGAVFLTVLLLGVIAWFGADILFENAIINACAVVLVLATLGRPAYRSAMKNWGEQ